MQTFPNSTERSSDFNSHVKFGVNKKYSPSYCFIFSKNWQTSSFIWISEFKTCPRDLQSMESVWPKISVEWSGQCNGMTLHQGPQVREGWTNLSPVLDPHWPMRGEHDIANTRAWLAIAPGPSLSLRPARPFYLRLNISNIFSSRLHIFWPTSHWIFSPTNTLKIRDQVQD